MWGEPVIVTPHSVLAARDAVDMRWGCWRKDCADKSWLGRGQG